MSMKEHMQDVRDALEQGETLIKEAGDDYGPLQDEGMNDMAEEKKKFDPAMVTKALLATLGTFGAQWGIDTNELINQVTLTPPENMGQSLIITAVVGWAVWYFKNREG